MMADIHPTAIVEAGAELGAGVRIGPFCHVHAGAVLHDGVELKGHVVVYGGTTIGKGTVVWPNAVLGGDPQSFGHKGGPTTLEIGENCIIREGVTMSRGSDGSRGVTRVGDGGFFMAYTHIAHDCIVGNRVIMANQATLAGHCEVGDHANIGGLTAVHQFVRIGHHAFVGGCSGLAGDVIPFGMAIGNRATLRGFNIIGMKRSGMSRKEIHELRRAYRQIFEGEGSMEENVAEAVAMFGDNALVADIAAFIGSRSRRYFCLPKRGGSEDDDGSDDS